MRVRIAPRVQNEKGRPTSMKKILQVYCEVMCPFLVVLGSSLSLSALILYVGSVFGPTAGTLLFLVVCLVILPLFLIWFVEVRE